MPCSRLLGKPKRYSPDIKISGRNSHYKSQANIRQYGLSVQGQKPFSFQVLGLGAFSRAEQPRVLWVGLEKSPELKVLQNTLDLNLKKIGISVEKRPFNPHLTIARVKDQNNPVDLQKITQVLSQNQTGSLGTLNVKEICLFQSELKPGGAVYTRLFTAKLG